MHPSQSRTLNAASVVVDNHSIVATLPLMTKVSGPPINDACRHVSFIQSLDTEARLVRTHDKSPVRWFWRPN
jgi:hypothetical protein